MESNRLERLVTALSITLGFLLIVPLVTGHISLPLGLIFYGFILLTLSVIHLVTVGGPKGPLIAILGLGSTLTLVGLGSVLWDFSFSGFSPPPSVSIPVEIPASFLPDWWIAAILLPCAVVILIDTTGVLPSAPEVPKDTRWSPLTIGTVLATVGLWGTLLAAGVTLLQKVLVFAPLFEEMLKFGVALLGALLIRAESNLSYIAIGIGVGSAFGIIEHFHTYPTEGDLNYLVRVLFHAATTAASVAIFLRILGASEGSLTVASVAPLGSMIAHGANNTLMIPVGLVQAAYGVSFGPLVSVLLLVALLAAALTFPTSVLLDVHKKVAGFSRLPTTPVGGHEGL